MTKNGYISRDLAEFLAAVVDNAKDPNAFKGNINTYTADVLATMIRRTYARSNSFIATTNNCNCIISMGETLLRRCSLE